jgi:hypothetical protein
MEDERIPKRFLMGNLIEKSSGKTKNKMGGRRSGDTLQILEIRGLKRRAEYREEGRRLLNQDRAQKRL